MIELTANDGQKITAYRADPADAPKGAVVLIHDRDGVDPNIRKLTDEFAAKGYVAVAPSLLDRGKAEAGSAAAPESAKEVGIDDALADIRTTVDAVKSAGKVAIVGYGWGGDVAYTAANEIAGLACSIGYCGSSTAAGPSAKRKIPTLMHFAENDPQLSKEDIIQFRANRPDVSAFTYPAGNGFGYEGSSDYNAEAAQNALERTLFWISQYVEGQPPIQLKNAGSYAQAKTDRKKKKKGGGDDLGPPEA